MSKRLILFLMVVVAIYFIADSPKAQDAPISGVVAGGAWTWNDFKDAGGGVQLGTQVQIDQERGLSIRTLYTQFDVGEVGPAKVIKTSVLSAYDFGKKWSFYFEIGGNFYMNTDSGDDGDFFGGFGASRRIYTADPKTWIVPGSVDLFGEVSFCPSDGVPTGDYVQLLLGLKFTKPFGKKVK